MRVITYAWYKETASGTKGGMRIPIEFLQDLNLWLMKFLQKKNFYDLCTSEIRKIILFVVFIFNFQQKKRYHENLPSYVKASKS